MKVPCWVQLLASGAICQSGLNKTKLHFFQDDALHSSSSNMSFIFQNQKVPACPLLSNPTPFHSLGCTHTPFLANPTADLARSPVGISDFDVFMPQLLPSPPLQAPCRCYPCPYPVSELIHKRFSGFLCFWVSAGTIFQDISKDQTILASFQITKASRRFS